MSKFKGRARIMAFAVGTAMLLCGSFTACTPTPGGPTGPVDEWAVTLDFNDDTSTPRTVPRFKDPVSRHLCSACHDMPNPAKGIPPDNVPGPKAKERHRAPRHEDGTNGTGKKGRP